MPPIIALLTDFGLEDPYVAQVKGAILGLCPDAQILDVTHGVRPFDVMQGAFFLEASRAHFPPGTIFVCVVDPGVGGPRKVVSLVKGGQVFIAPDNGLLSLVLADPKEASAFDLSAHTRAGGVSATFHGRDVFGPLAARVAMGEKFLDLGHGIFPDDLMQLPWAKPFLAGDKGVRATVMHVDRFGNCILNLPVDEWHRRLDRSEGLFVATDTTGRGPAIFALTYGDLDQDVVGVMAGSQGFLELSMNQQSAAAHLKITSGDVVTLTPRTAK